MVQKVDHRNKKFILSSKRAASFNSQFLSCFKVFHEGEVSYFIDGKYELKNWLKFVNCARSEREQNLIVVQDGFRVFFEVTCDIFEGTELLVWYGDSYLKYMGLPITMKEKISPQLLSNLG